MKNAISITLLIVFSPFIIIGILCCFARVAWHMGFDIGEAINDYIS